MSPIAIVMLVISVVILWGGLVAAIVNIRVRPAVNDVDDPDALTADSERDAPLHRDT